MSIMWNLWHGCHKVSAGCQNCYVYRMDAEHGRDSSVVAKTASFGLPLKRSRDGSYKLSGGETVYTCFTSDFLLEDADAWRPEAWRMMRLRSDLHFFMITKRITRLARCLPPDWGNGYPNVTLCCTVENQAMADLRLPVYKDAPVRHKIIVCEPLLERIDLSSGLGDWIEKVIVGGESGKDARMCCYEWVLNIRDQCLERRVPFSFKQTGARFAKDGRLYHIKRPLQGAQARKAGIDHQGAAQPRESSP